MKRFIICIIMMLSISLTIQAQNVERKGNTFTQVSNKKVEEAKETKTEYIYIDSKGIQYPVYLSAKGKAFIKKISRKTGKEYPKYLPEIGKQINPDAYKDEKDSKQLN